MICKSMDRNLQFFTLEIFITTGVITAKDVSISVIKPITISPLLSSTVIKNNCDICFFGQNSYGCYKKSNYNYELDVHSLFNENGDLDTALVYID